MRVVRYTVNWTGSPKSSTFAVSASGSAANSSNDLCRSSRARSNLGCHFCGDGFSRGHRLRGLTFEVSGRRRQDARPGLAKMYHVPPDRAWRPAVGAPLERAVRPHCALTGRLEPHICDAPTVSRQVLELVESIEVINRNARDGLGLG